MQSTTLIDRTHYFDSLGVFIRPAKSGPESDLVTWFLKWFSEKTPIKIPRGCQVTIFREPKLESGFPDLVIVIWSAKTAFSWNKLRNELTQEDIRLIHYLVCEGPCDYDKLNVIFPNNIATRLEKLKAANMVRQRVNSWSARPLSKIFAVRRIISIEAKINELSTALEQAYLNTWFASHSYILVPRVPKKESLINTARALGVGIWARNIEFIEASSQPEMLPRSYASWLFNEWAWKTALIKDRTTI
ncbi:MAG: hypothetical protein U1F76_21570 [Candidatus Competibacteraceae bacterium]